MQELEKAPTSELKTISKDEFFSNLKADDGNRAPEPPPYVPPVEEKKKEAAPKEEPSAFNYSDEPKGADIPAPDEGFKILIKPKAAVIVIDLVISVLIVLGVEYAFEVSLDRADIKASKEQQKDLEPIAEALLSKLNIPKNSPITASIINLLGVYGSNIADALEKRKKDDKKAADITERLRLDDEDERPTPQARPRVVPFSPETTLFPDEAPSKKDKKKGPNIKVIDGQEYYVYSGGRRVKKTS